MKSGFVMLAGRSNVGKSTLLNALVGSKVAIVTPKPQTTRHPVRGILHDATRGQLVFIDTPGIFLGKKDHVSRRLNDLVKETLEGVDAIVYVLDPTREPGREEELIQQLLRTTTIPIIAVINKADAPEAQKYLATVQQIDVGQKKTIEISAKTHKNLNLLVDHLFSLASEGTLMYPDAQFTDVSHQTWLEELIREKLFLALREEVPYSLKVVIDEMETRHDGSRYVRATIWTTDDRYKRMIIGHGGKMIKEVGMKARKELEIVTQKKIFLDLEVAVDAKWQEHFV